MVADMSAYVGSAADADEVSVCSLGVYGTKYVRNSGDTVPSELSIAKGFSKTIVIDNITSELEIGNELDINMREKTQLGIVSFTELSSSTEVLIDSTG